MGRPWTAIAHFSVRLKETAAAWSVGPWKDFLVEYRLFFQSAEALFVAALWIAAISAGGDITLWIPLLFLSWLFGAISIGTTNWEVRKRYSIGVVMTLCMIATAGYILVAHRQNENSSEPLQSKATLSAPTSAPAEPNTDPEALGFFAVAFIRLYDTPELRRKYIFDFVAPTKAQMSFYVSPSDLFVFSVADVNNEAHSLEVPIASDVIPLNRYIFLYCEAALEGRSTHLRILVDGKQIADRTLGVRVELGKDYWKWKHVTFGADTNGQNNAPFKMAMTGSGHKPLTEAQIKSFMLRFESFLAGSNSPLEYR